MACRPLLALLLALAAVGAARAQPTPDRIAFELPLDRQILFPIVVNGRPAEAWLDSGASVTVLDTAFARQLGTSAHGQMQAVGVAGAVSGVQLANVDMQVGHLLFPDRQVAVVDLKAIGEVVQRPVQVIVGRDVFDHAIVDIDFRSRSLQLLPRETFVAPDTTPIPLLASGALRAVPVIIDGVQTSAVLDLGNGGSLLVDRAFAEAHHLLSGRPTSALLAVGADGARASTAAVLDKVQLAGVTLRDVPVTAPRGLASQAPANIGLAILSRFHLTIDFAGGRMWASPYDDASTAVFQKNRSGLAVVPQGDRLRITFVSPHSPAARGGWKVGDLITAIDGQPIDPGFAASERALWSFGPAGRRVTLTLADGRRRELQLADYY
jgi:hypothetical protein